MEALRDLDQVAYVRFASVYREFKDVNQFLDELKPLLGRGQPGAEPDRQDREDRADRVDREDRGREGQGAASS